MLVKSQTKPCDKGTNILLSTSFAGQQIKHIYTVAIKFEIYVIPFPVTVFRNSLLRYKHYIYPVDVTTFKYIPFSSSLESRIFSFDLT